MGRLFNDGVVAVSEEPLAHGLGIFFGGEGADLDVEELVLLLVPDSYGVTAFFQCGEQDVGVFLVGDGGYLDEWGSGCRGCYGGDKWLGGSCNKDRASGWLR